MTVDIEFLKRQKAHFQSAQNAENPAVPSTSEPVVRDEPNKNPPSKAEELKQKGSEVIDKVADKAEDLKDKAADKAKELGNKAADKAEELKQKGSETADKVADKAEDLKDKAADKAKEFGNKVADKAEEVKQQKGSDFIEKAADKTKELKDKVINKAEEMLGDNDNKPAKPTGLGHEAAHKDDVTSNVQAGAYRVGGVTYDVGDKAKEVGDKVGEKIDNLKEGVKDTAHHVVETVKGAFGKAKEKAEELVGGAKKADAIPTQGEANPDLLEEAHAIASKLRERTEEKVHDAVVKGEQDADKTKEEIIAILNQEGHLPNDMTAEQLRQLHIAHDGRHADNAEHPPVVVDDSQHTDTLHAATGIPGAEELAHRMEL